MGAGSQVSNQIFLSTMFITYLPSIKIRQVSFAFCSKISDNFFRTQGDIFLSSRKRAKDNN